MISLFKAIWEHPPSLVYIICMATALTGFISTVCYTAKTRRIFALLKGPVPKMSDSKGLATFQESRKALRAKADDCGVLGVASSFICVLLLVLLYGFFNNDQKMYYIFASALQLSTVVYFVFGCIRSDTRIENILAQRAELSCLKYYDALTKRRKPKGKGQSKETKERYFWGSLDDSCMDLVISDREAQQRIAAPIDLQTSKRLSDAIWTASHDEKPLANEPVLIIWRDGQNKKVKMVVSKAATVEDVPAESLITSPGKAMITAAGEQFCGGKVAYFCGKPNTRIERGWLATADRAHVLLGSLRWLDDDQRQFCYQLINPGESYPPDFAVNLD